MSKCYVLTVKTELAADWENLVPGPKLGRLTDPEKIEKKRQEWLETAEEEAYGDRVASEIKGYTLYNPKDDTSTYGKSGGEFVEEYLGKIKQGEATLVCLNARVRVSQLALQAVKEGIKVPEELFCRTGGEFSRNRKIIDPIRVITRSTEEDDKLLEYLGIPTEGLKLSASEPEQFATIMPVLGVIEFD